MKVQPIAAPAAQAQPQGQSARDKAVAAFMGSQNANAVSPQMAVHNQNAITPEEITGNDSVPMQTGQADVTETQQVDKVETPEQQQLSRQFAQLARQEKINRQKFLQQDQALKAREAALQAKESQTPTAPDYSNHISKDLFRKDPLGALQQAGLSYDEVTQQFLNPTTVDPRLQSHIEGLEEKLKTFEDKFGSLEKSAQERETQAYNSALKQIEVDTKALVAADDTYEMIKATRSEKDVVQLIKETFDKDGTLLSVEEAAQEVEEYLLEEAYKLSNTNKIKAKLAAVAPKPTVVQQPTQPQKTQMKTLTNAQSSTRQLSSRERAIAAFNGNKT